MITSDVVTQWIRQVSEVALVFESRWTVLALRRVNSDLAGRVQDQRDLFTEAVVTGSVRDVAEHGAAMLRGYQLAIAALEAAGAADDAYLLGCDPGTETMVAIGDQKAAADRVRELYGDRVIWISPDEVATLFASVEALKSIGAVKRLYPGSEIMRAGASVAKTA